MTDTESISRPRRGGTTAAERKLAPDLARGTRGAGRSPGPSPQSGSGR